MSISLGGLGLVSLRDPFADLPALISGRGDLRLFLCLIVFAIVSLVLAYLTNPSENSFRAYLTEQSFRHHLRRLDAHPDDPPTCSPPWQNQPKNDPSTFHFATRASISLRTPKHVFHSFAIFTIAAMVPLPRQDHSTQKSHDMWLISDSWYIGAFGKWWRGGLLEAWYHDLISRGKDEEIWSSGILSMKRLDALHDYRASLFPPGRASMTIQQDHQLAPHGPSEPHAIPTRHVMKRSSHDATLQSPGASPPRSSEPCSTDVPNANVSVKASTLVDSMPLISEIMQQIADKKASVNDLRTQLSEYQSSASRSHALLQTELDQHRLRKRRDDASRTELRAQMKTVEDSKRTTESLKRDADKKLKVAETNRQDAITRIRALDAQISDAHARILEDQSFTSERQSQPIPFRQQELQNNVESQKAQVKLLESTVVSLNQRTRTLEERLAIERDRLQQLRNQRLGILNSTLYVPVHGDPPRTYLQPASVTPLQNPVHPAHSGKAQDLYNGDLYAQSQHVDTPAQNRMVRSGPATPLRHFQPTRYSLDQQFFPDRSVVPVEPFGPPTGVTLHDPPPNPFLRHHSSDEWTPSPPPDPMYNRIPSWQPHRIAQPVTYHLNTIGVDTPAHNPPHPLHGGHSDFGKTNEETASPPSPRPVTHGFTTKPGTGTSATTLPPASRVGSTSSPFIHAFAPSPAEQAVLKSLGVLKKSVLEVQPRLGSPSGLPSLSHLSHHIQTPSTFPPSDLQSTTFSPWDDDDEIHNRH